MQAMVPQNAGHPLREHRRFLACASLLALTAFPPALRRADAHSSGSSKAKTFPELDTPDIVMLPISQRNSQVQTSEDGIVAGLGHCGGGVRQRLELFQPIVSANHDQAVARANHGIFGGIKSQFTFRIFYG